MGNVLCYLNNKSNVDHTEITESTRQDQVKNTTYPERYSVIDNKVVQFVIDDGIIAFDRIHDSAIIDTSQYQDITCAVCNVNIHDPQYFNVCILLQGSDVLYDVAFHCKCYCTLYAEIVEKND
jgi:hypothetical protein